MSKHTTVKITADQWTELTSSDVTEITFQNQGSAFMLVQVTVGSVAPTNKNGSVRYNPGQGESGTPLSELAPGIAGTRVWAMSGQAVSVFVSHA